MSKLEPIGPRQPQLSRRQLLRGAGLGSAAVLRGPRARRPARGLRAGHAHRRRHLRPGHRTRGPEPGGLDPRRRERGHVGDLPRAARAHQGRPRPRPQPGPELHRLRRGARPQLHPPPQLQVGRRAAAHLRRPALHLGALRQGGAEGWSNVDSVETPDDRTINLRLKQPFAPLLLGVAGVAHQGGGPVLPRHAGEGRQQPAARRLQPARAGRSGTARTRPSSAAGPRAAAIGISYGAISGFFGGMLDIVLMRVVDFFLSFPRSSSCSSSPPTGPTR